MKCSHILVAVLLPLLSACGGGGDDGEGGGGDFVPITSTQPASLVAAAIADTSANLVSTGTYNNTVITVPGGGSATVSGSKSYSGYQSCGSDCVTSSNSANLTITYNDYYAPPTRAHTNSKVRLTGTVTLTDNRRSTQSGLSYSSSGEQRVTATSMLTVRLEITDSTGRTYGYADTLSALTAYGSGSWDGWMRPSNGVTYSF